MKIGIDSDNVGMGLKRVLVEYLKAEGYDITDLDVLGQKEVLYPEVAENLAVRVAKGEYDRGILVCGTGLGMAIAANKIKGVYAGTCHDVYSASRLRRSNNANILTMGARVIGPELAKMVVDEYLRSEFEEEHSGQNVRSLRELEAETLK